MPIQNPYTLGNAWFVDKVQYVNNANEEIESLHKVMPAKVAVVDGDIAGLIDKLKATVAAGKDYDTFGGKSDKTEGTVKFIYRTESISADDE